MDIHESGQVLYHRVQFQSVIFVRSVYGARLPVRPVQEVTGHCHTIRVWDGGHQDSPVLPVQIGTFNYLSKDQTKITTSQQRTKENCDQKKSWSFIMEWNPYSDLKNLSANFSIYA